MTCSRPTHWIRLPFLAAGLAAAQLAIAGFSLSAVAQVSWTGQVSNDWLEAGNWDGEVPTGTDEVHIDTISPNPAAIDGVPAQSGDIHVGIDGAGQLSIINGGVLDSAIIRVGSGPGSEGAVEVSGSGSEWTNTIGLSIGSFGSGLLTVSDGGSVSSTASPRLGQQPGSQGTLILTGSGSSWNSTGELHVGSHGTGSLLVEDGASMTSGGHGFVGSHAAGSATVTGSGSAWTVGSESTGAGFRIGDNNVGTLLVDHGATVISNSAHVGRRPGSEGSVVVSASGSEWQVGSSLSVGHEGSGSLLVASGGSVSNHFGQIGSLQGGEGTATVTGTGSQWISSGGFRVGSTGTGTLNIEDGGSVTSGDASVLGIGGDTILGHQAGAHGSVSVAGASSSWHVESILRIGRLGTGILTISDGATVNVAGDPDTFVLIATGADSAGSLNIGAAAGDPAAAPGVLNAVSIRFGTDDSGDGRLVFNHLDEDYPFSAEILSDGLIHVLDGTTVLGADSSGFDGQTEIAGGMLQVEQVLGGTVEVLAGGRLGGAGTVGSTQVAGTLSPGSSIGTLTIDGDLTLTGSAVYEFEVAASTSDSDLIVVQGDLVLDGTVNVAADDGIAEGQYLLMTYVGDLTDNGLNVGGLPPELGAIIDTSIPGEVRMAVFETEIFNDRFEAP